MPELEDPGPPPRTVLSGGSADAMRVVHWLPSDALTWTCPTCRVTLVRGSTDEPWSE